MPRTFLSANVVMSAVGVEREGRRGGKFRPGSMLRLLSLMDTVV